MCSRRQMNPRPIHTRSGRILPTIAVVDITWGALPASLARRRHTALAPTNRCVMRSAANPIAYHSGPAGAPPATIAHPQTAAAPPHPATAYSS